MGLLLSLYMGSWRKYSVRDRVPRLDVGCKSRRQSSFYEVVGQLCH